MAQAWPEWMVCDSVVEIYYSAVDLLNAVSNTEGACDPLVMSVRPGTWLVLHPRWARRFSERTASTHRKGRRVLSITIQRAADGSGRVIYHYTPVERSEWKRMRKAALENARELLKGK
ncbi:MAG: hypothetical protein QM724_09485 [Flavobacteriales bacterium]